jgi:hypothetical protein
MTTEEKHQAIKSLKEQIKDIEKSIELLKLDLNYSQKKLAILSNDGNKPQ